MEGTSGAAERAPLRGGTRKAALAPVPRERVRRPWVRESGSSVLGRTRTAKSGSVRHARARVPRKRASTTQASPACARHELRREVSEPIGLGRSSHRERSRWEAPSRGKLTLARPLARDISAGRGFGVYVGNRSHPQLNAAIERSRPRERLLPAGDRGCGHAGFWRSVVVLAGHIDCRSRQAARGPSRPGTKSPRPRRWV